MESRESSVPREKVVRAACHVASHSHTTESACVPMQVDKEENAKLIDVVFRWLTHDEGVRMDAFDAEVNLGELFCESRRIVSRISANCFTNLGELSWSRRFFCESRRIVL